MDAQEQSPLPQGKGHELAAIRMPLPQLSRTVAGVRGGFPLVIGQGPDFVWLARRAKNAWVPAYDQRESPVDAGMTIRR
jgi:hypothetical protein